MLVLSRRTGERIHVGGIVVTVTRITGRKVYIGIDAPPEMRIVRDELVKAANNTAGEPDDEND